MRAVDVDDRQDEDAQAEPRAHRARRWLVVGTVVALVGAALVVGQSVVDSRERAALAAFDALPGVLDPVDEQLHVVRRVAQEDLRMLWTPSGGVVTADDGSQAYTWTDPDSGRDLWTASLLGPTPALAGGEEDGGYDDTTCLPDIGPMEDRANATRVVCLVTDGGMRPPETKSEATTSKVMVLDVTDGSVLADWAPPAAGSFALVPDGIVIASLTDRAVNVTIYDLLTGDKGWTLIRGRDVAEGESDRPWDFVGVTAVGDRLLLQGTDSRETLLSLDGQLLRDVSTDDVPDFQGWNIDWTSSRVSFASTDADGLETTTIVSPDGVPAHDLVLAGAAVDVGIDDGSLPGLVLTMQGHLLAWDDETGEQRWKADDVMVSATDVIVRRARLYVLSGDDVVALDGRTGERLWSIEKEGSLTNADVLTDGRHLLVPHDAMDGRGTPALVAYDLVTGHEAFRVPYPAGSMQVMVQDRGFLAYDAAADEYLVLG